MVAPRATYRLQFRDGFDFAAAAEVAGYLARLGVSHVYASPVFAASSGSTHGYDVTDFNTLDPSLGGRAGFERMVEALNRHDLGLILDFVPNHMAASVENPWWRDVLEHGRKSVHAEAFDIDWDRFDGRLLLPVLGDAYGTVLERGEITVVVEDERATVAYFDHRFPTSPDSRAMLADAEPDPARLHQFLEAQHYRLCHWRLAGDALNYRRFFEINDLAVIRVDRAEVYERVHALVFELIGHGMVDGLRLDHIDGLKDPAGYLQRLQADTAAARGSGPFYLLVEKILGPGEPLRDWPVAGTTGYEFANLVTGLQVDAGGADRLCNRYEAFTGDRRKFSEIASSAKRFILALSFSGELQVLSDLAHRFAQDHLVTRDIGAEALRRAITEVLVALPVYRTYVTARGPSAQDIALIDKVCATAARRLGQESADAVAFLRRLMKAEETGWADFAIRLQQLAGPLMAKSLEDTAFYRWVPLLALNEVGGEPAGNLPTIDTFHGDNRQRLQRWPANMLTTATHDTKRGEDARARLAALSYEPDTFADAVEGWWALHQPLRRQLEDGPAPQPKDAWLFYQSLVGIWPLELSPDDGEGLGELCRRLQQYMQKALREAKERTRWTDVNSQYEAAVSDFVAAVLDPASSAPFLAQVRALARRIAPAGAANGLAQLLFKLTAPGVPDIYQGTEWWDLSLVDPDNRRPVDYATRASDLEEFKGLAVDLERGAAKQQVMATVLALRRDHPDLFSKGDYLPLAVDGPAGDAVVCYARTLGSRALLVSAFRHGRETQDALSGSHISLPGSLARLQWTNMFGTDRVATKRELALAPLFGSLPIALLHGQTGGE
jgi:(1->4)-alpha-D-glucan 1-alpha-D-glucosylmutase